MTDLEHAASLLRRVAQLEILVDGLLAGLAAGIDPRQLAEELAVIAARPSLHAEIERATAEGAIDGTARTLREILARASTRPPE